jgi:hypothetical protein
VASDDGTGVIRPLALAALLFGPATAAVAQLPRVPLPECVVAVGADSDRDGLSDSCELAAARSMAPLLMVRSGGCNWDTATATGRIGGGYLHAVQRADSMIRVAYLPAYFRDCGWHGGWCQIPWIDCSPHDGDSEFIAVELVPSDDGVFEVTGLFLSAHCFGRSSRSCRWYRGADLERFRWHGTSPVIWVAEGRHANYRSWSECERGHHFLDRCSQHDMSYHFPVDPRRNVGSRSHPFADGGCVYGRELAAHAVDPDAQECFWRADVPFRGWQADGAGVTPYDRYLREVAGFD